MFFTYCYLTQSQSSWCIIFRWFLTCGIFSRVNQISLLQWHIHRTGKGHKMELLVSNLLLCIGDYYIYETKSRFNHTHITADVQDATEWKDSDILHTKWNLGLAMSSDGMSLFTTSRKYKIWPVFVTILNLPPTIRFSIDNSIVHFFLSFILDLAQTFLLWWF